MAGFEVFTEAGEQPEHHGTLCLEERQHSVVQEVGSRDGRLRGV
tara:strand:- start:237 stop:368 length:132 start_codon:yes stop_codon:yes gene_type:complete